MTAIRLQSKTLTSVNRPSRRVELYQCQGYYCLKVWLGDLPLPKIHTGKKAYIYNLYKEYGKYR